MAVFVDTSALVKLYVAEPGHRIVRRNPGPFVVLSLTRVEIVAAFRVKHRTGELSGNEARVLAQQHEADLHDSRCWTGQELVRIAPDELVLAEAARLCAAHGLRAYDAVQLATAQLARRVDPDCRTMSTFDKQLSRASAAQGFALLTS